MANCCAAISYSKCIQSFIDTYRYCTAVQWDCIVQQFSETVLYSSTVWLYCTAVQSDCIVQQYSHTVLYSSTVRLFFSQMSPVPTPFHVVLNCFIRNSSIRNLSSELRQLFDACVSYNTRCSIGFPATRHCRGDLCDCWLWKPGYLKKLSKLTRVWAARWVSHISDKRANMKWQMMLVR